MTTVFGQVIAAYLISSFVLTAIVLATLIKKESVIDVEDVVYTTIVFITSPISIVFIATIYVGHVFDRHRDTVIWERHK